MQPLHKIAIMREIQSGGVNVENVPMKMLDTPDCSICEKPDCTEECLSFHYGMSVKVCPKCKNHSIVNNEETYKFCPECGQAIELEESEVQERPIELNPQTKVTYDENMYPHYEFGGYDISPEDMEELRRRYGNGK